MKYKVLKECVIESKYHAVGDIYHQGRCMTLKALMALIDNGFIEGIKDEPWKPKEGELYHYVACNGLFRSARWVGCTEDRNRLEMGNCFKNTLIAGKAAAWLRAFKVLRDDAKGFKPDWQYQKCKHSVAYDHFSKRLIITNRRVPRRAFDGAMYELS